MATIDSIPTDLLEARSAAEAARAAYHGHKYRGDPADIQALVAFDLEEIALRDACATARVAYERALSAHLTSLKAVA